MKKAIVVGIAALVLTAGASAATAAVMSGGPVDSAGVIHGCWSNRALNGSHVFVLQDAGTSCPQGTTAISWNTKGASPGIDGGTVVLDNQAGTCTVLHSFGPDAVNVSYVARPDINPGLHVCALSGLPANADVQVTPVFTSGIGSPGTVATLYPDTGSTGVALSLSGALGFSGEFNWLAVPSS